MASGSLIDGILGRYDGMRDGDVPPPPEWVARYLHVLVVRRLAEFRASLPPGVSFRVSSGFRAPAHNQRVGGVANSAHIHGLAVDVVASSSSAARTIADAWSRLGGVAIIESDHVHLHLPRAWGWRVVRAVASVGVIAAALLLLLVFRTGYGKKK